jgi:hypothetical protein
MPDERSASHELFPPAKQVLVMVSREATGMTAEKKAARHRQWAANAIADAIRMESEADRETLMMIARQHLAMAQEAERSAARAE